MKRALLYFAAGAGLGALAVVLASGLAVLAAFADHGDASEALSDNLRRILDGLDPWA